VLQAAAISSFISLQPCVAVHLMICSRFFGSLGYPKGANRPGYSSQRSIEMGFLLVFFFALLSASFSSASLLPILCVHGWQGFATDFANITKEVNANFPGRHIASVNLFDGKLSEKLPIYEQVRCALRLQSILILLTLFQARLVRVFIESDEHLRGGQPFILIGHSQGTLVSRALLEEWDDHPVQMFLSLAGPHLGQYGLFADLVSNPFLRGLVTQTAWTLLYTQVIRMRAIFANHVLPHVNASPACAGQLLRIELLARSAPRCRFHDPR
jgi:pimeloyl-ACP methyl ester carboxylesterase